MPTLTEPVTLIRFVTEAAVEALAPQLLVKLPPFNVSVPLPTPLPFDSMLMVPALSVRPPVWLPAYATAQSRPLNFLGLITLSFALAKELSGEAQLERAQLMAATCDCARDRIDSRGKATAAYSTRSPEPQNRYDHVGAAPCGRPVSPKTIRFSMIPSERKRVKPASPTPYTGSHVSFPHRLGVHQRPHS